MPASRGPWRRKFLESICPTESSKIISPDGLYICRSRLLRYFGPKYANTVSAGRKIRVSGRMTMLMEY
jgi:hypothetical protein